MTSKTVWIDSVERPAQNSLGQAIAQTQDGLVSFWRWFADSSAVDALGRPLVLYHGTGNLENLDSFDPGLTGNGNDQIGSGFYFTTSTEEASAYTTAITPQAGENAIKLGGDASPGVAIVYLNIRHPVSVNGHTLKDEDLSLTIKQAAQVIRRAPHIYDLEESPLQNWHDIWLEGIQERMIDGVAKHYKGTSLISLENDFFRDHSTAFREALRDTTGRDGASIVFPNEKVHWVAWFPDQIRPALCVDRWVDQYVDVDENITRAAPASPK